MPGAILFAIIGLGPLGAAVLTWQRHPVAPLLTCTVGAGLLIWLVVEFAVVGYTNHPPLQALYLGLGVAITLVGVALILQRGFRLFPRGLALPPGLLLVGAPGISPGHREALSSFHP